MSSGEDQTNVSEKTKPECGSRTRCFVGLVVALLLFAVLLSPDSGSSSSSSERTPFVPKPIFSSYKIYKTKTALDISVVRAQLGWNSPKVEERRYLSLKKGGGFRLTFAGGENKAYNWEEGQVITLSVTELGDLLAFAQNKVSERKEGELRKARTQSDAQASILRVSLVLTSARPALFCSACLACLLC